MNLKKHISSALAVLLLSVGAFAYPVVEDKDPVAPFLQQYQQQMQELQKGFEQKLLPPFKSIATLALQVQQSAQEELTAEQNAALEKHSAELDKNLTDLLAPALQTIDLAQFNEQYAQNAKTYGLPEHQFTLQEITDMFKGMYLIGALSYFEQTKKLNQEELTVLAEIFFPQEEEPAKE